MCRGQYGGYNPLAQFPHNSYGRLPPPLRKPDETLKFSLKYFSHVRRTAFGIHNAQKIYLNIWFDDYDSVTDFCFHLDGDKPKMHMPCHVSKRPPERVVCGKPNRLVHQMTSIASRLFWEDCNMELEDIREELWSAVNKAYKYCMVCGYRFAKHFSLHRSTTCTRECSRRLRQSQLEVRLPEFLVDESAVWIIVMSVSAAVTCDHLHLLEPSPLTEDEFDYIGRKLMDIPRHFSFNRSSTSSLAKSIQSWVPRNSRMAENFLSYSLTSYRGSLTSAPYEDIPKELRGKGGMFLLSSKPELEKAFARKLTSSGESSIVFHGTTLDRLHPILHNGLQHDRQSLQQNGRYFGDGIYTTNDSTVAMRYAKLFTIVKSLDNMKISFGFHALLICELVGAQKYWLTNQITMSGKSCDIYVTNDPEYIIVRAVIVAKRGTEIPKLDMKVFDKMFRTSKSFRTFD